MPNKKLKWLIYTVLIGFIPMFARLLLFFVITNRSSQEIVSTSDLVTFGLVLHISNINELEHVRKLEANWKTVQTGTSIFFVCIYSILFAFSLIASSNPGTFDEQSMKIGTSALCVSSLALSYSIYDKISRTEGKLK